MTKQWQLLCAGAGEEDQAHLRLLLRSARKLVSEEWVWGDEALADLVLIGRQEPIEEAAIQRASQAGVASAQLIDADEPAPAGLFLRKPFHKDAFAALLNEVARGAVAGEAAGGVEIEGSVEAGAVQVDPSLHPAEPTVADAPAEGDLAMPANEAVAPVVAKAAEPSADDNVMRALLYYLPKRVFGGPARIALPGAPPLVIDPDARMFWAEGSLTMLEPYVRDQLRFGDWKRLGSEELEEISKGSDARPYAYLTWLDTFIHSRGSLSRRFDPEGTYRLTKRLDLANDYPRALRISAQMSQPRRLDAIARASGADLAEVFDVVNAYEAIGYLEWTRSGAAPSKRS